ncbi:MAG TPA: hypothetical protein DEX20_01220 [Halieaceae bacterium]|nr:hypothetical protein [Halieaceae bacterium]
MLCLFTYDVFTQNRGVRNLAKDRLKLMRYLMKKYAVCLHGLSDGFTDKTLEAGVDISEVAKSLKSNLIEFNDCDLFFHTWKHPQIHELLQIYQPIKSEVQSSIIFHKNSVVDDLKHWRRKFLFGQNHRNRRNAIFSRWYSFKRSTDLAFSYANDYGFEYSRVVVTRFDMLLRKPLDLSALPNEEFTCGGWAKCYDDDGYEVSEIDVSLGHKYKFKGRKGFPYDSEGLHDFWFAADSSMMRKFATCYDHLPALIDSVGLSSHKAALQHLRNQKLMRHLGFNLDFPMDYTLARWLS